MADLSLFDLTGKKALVTGGGKGIGFAFATALANAGADVAILGRDPACGEHAASAVRQIGRDSCFVKCDVGQHEEVRSAVGVVVARFGRLDIAVNNAGTYRSGDDQDYAKHDWDAVVAVNLGGAWSCAQIEMQHMVEQQPLGGKIINVASIGAYIACSNAAYDASKAGIVQMTRTLAARWGKYNINVNCISPGYVVSSFERAARERARLRALTPLGYVGRARDLQGVVIFLASSASDFVTGQDVIVDGGHTLSTWMQPADPALHPRVAESAEIPDEV